MRRGGCRGGSEARAEARRQGRRHGHCAWRGNVIVVMWIRCAKIGLSRRRTRVTGLENGLLLLYNSIIVTICAKLHSSKVCH